MFGKETSASRFVESAPSEYGFASVISGPIKAEPPREDPKANQWLYVDLLRDLQWSEDDYSMAKRYGFPADRHGYLMAPNATRKLFFHRDAVMAWLAAFRADAARLLK